MTNPVAPGEYLTIFGSDLASGTFPQAGQTLAVPFPTTLGNVQVTVAAESLRGNSRGPETLLAQCGRAARYPRLAQTLCF